VALHVCADKHDVLKVNFTLAAFEADDPFVKEVSVSVLHFEYVELLCSQVVISKDRIAALEWQATKSAADVIAARETVMCEIERGQGILEQWGCAGLVGQRRAHCTQGCRICQWPFAHVSWKESNACRS
jgi:hypothetical protein